MAYNDIGKELFESELDLSLGSKWPKAGYIKVSSHSGKSISKEFATMDEFNRFMNDDMDTWIGAVVREHWPESNFAEANPA